MGISFPGTRADIKQFLRDMFDQYDGENEFVMEFNIPDRQHFVGKGTVDEDGDEEFSDSDQRDNWVGEFCYIIETLNKELIEQEDVVFTLNDKGYAQSEYEIEFLFQRQD